MSEISLCPYLTNMKCSWDAVVTNSKNGNFLHLRDYLDYHSHRFNEQSVLVERKGKVVAVFPCNRIEEKIISHGGVTYAGLIFGTELHVRDVLVIFELLVNHFRQQGASSLIYKAVPHIFHRYLAEEDLYALYKLQAKLVRRDLSSVIQLANRPRLSDSRKCTIRKANKFGLVIREGVFFDKFHALLTKALSKFLTVPVHSIAELELLNSRFPSRIRLFGAYRDELLLAGAIIYDFEHVVHTQYLASSDDGKEMGALDYLLAHLIENVFPERIYFSFGISTEQGGRYLNEGLIFQKEGFGARGVTHDTYEVNMNFSLDRNNEN